MDACDVIVIGGGPAGSTAAALLAEKGCKVALFERERFPRFHIGESLMTETWWVLERLGLLARMAASEFPRKHSVQFISETGKKSRPFYFSEFNPHPSSVTWQVERAEFDHMLLKRARECGADVREGTQVREVIFEVERAVGVRYAPADGADGVGAPGAAAGGAEEMRAPVTIDASGQSALIGRRLNLLKKDPKLIKAAVFAHYEGGIRDAGIDEGAILVCHTRENHGWFWYIPLSRNRVSIGVVGDSAEMLKGRGTPEEVLQAEIDACGEIARRLVPAKRVSPVRVLRDCSYRSDQPAGDGWVLAGDAFGFLDPVYSSGVLLALKSGSLVADSVEAALKAKDYSAAKLGAHGPELARGMEMVRKLVYAFYTPGFSFAQFIMEHPEHRRGITEILIGNVFREGVEKIFQDMAKYCQLPETRPLAAGRPAAQAS